MSSLKKNSRRVRLSSMHNFIFKDGLNILKNRIDKDRNLLKKLNNDYGQVNKANWTETYSILKKEFFNEMEGVKSVAILLTGGMDSRVAASLLYQYSQLNDKLKVTAYTWGSTNSRDVIYSKKICEIFDWNFIHIELSIDDFIESIELSKNSNASISPIHFHGVGAVTKHIKFNPVDKIIAASYGDSLGRGEYSGVHINCNKRLVDYTYSKWSPLFSSEEREVLHSDITNEFVNSNITNSGLIHEMIFQYCYMGMMLEPVFDCINDISPVYQIMTSDIFRYHILTYNREIRNDEFYLHIIKNMNPELSEIPWARTGVLFGSDDETNKDNYRSIYSDYPNIIRSLFKKNIISNIENINSFTKFYYFILMSFWKIFKTEKVTFYDEFFSLIYVFNELAKRDKKFIINNNDIKVNNFLKPYIYILAVWFQEKIKIIKSI